MEGEQTSLKTHQARKRRIIIKRENSMSNQENRGQLTPEELDSLDFDTLKEKVLELDKEAQAYYGKYKHYKKKANTPKEEVQETKPNKPESSSPAPSEDKLARLELKVEGYSDDEIDFLLPYGGKKAAENPFVKKAIEQLREEKKLSEATSINGNGSDRKEKQYTEDDLRGKSSEEIAKLIQTGKIKVE